MNIKSVLTLVAFVFVSSGAIGTNETSSPAINPVVPKTVAAVAPGTFPTALSGNWTVKESSGYVWTERWGLRDIDLVSGTAIVWYVTASSRFRFCSGENYMGKMSAKVAFDGTIFTVTVIAPPIQCTNSFSATLTRNSDGKFVGVVRPGINRNSPDLDTTLSPL